MKIINKKIQQINSKSFKFFSNISSSNEIMTNLYEPVKLKYQTDLFDEMLHQDFTKQKYPVYGSATIDIPDFYRQNMIESVQKNSVADFQYSATQGRQDLLESLSKNFPFTKNYSLNRMPIENLQITQGGLWAVFESIYTYLRANDEVVCLTPYYPAHLGPVNRVGGKAKLSNMIYNEKKQQFDIDWKHFESQFNKNTKYLFLINPHNPTGKVYTREEFLRISNFLEENYPKVMVIEDAAYFCYVNEGSEWIPFHTIQPFNWKKTFTCFSGGKIFNTTGSRIGWVLADKYHINNMRESIYNDLNWTSNLEQSAMSKNIESAIQKNYKNTDLDYYEHTRQDINQRIVYLQNICSKNGILPLNTEGTYYFLADIKNFKDRIPVKYYYRIDKPDTYEPYADKAFCRWILDTTGVSFLPNSQLCDQNQQFSDNLIRLTANRSYEDLDMVDKVLQDINY